MTDKSEISDNTVSEERIFDHLEQVDIRTRLDALINRLGNWVSLLFLFSMAVTVYEVISRYLFNAPTLWAHETTIMLVGITFAFGGAFCLSRNSHISIKLLYDIVSPRTRQGLDIFNALLGFIYTAAIAYAAFEMARKSLFMPTGLFKLETSGSAWNPPFPPVVKSALFLCAFLMAMQNLMHFIKAVTGGPVAPHGVELDQEAN
ncbi:MAG: TRAP transporter small permease [Gammaproteobacteria bacterium]|nr:TRAP transporter small permease [Gammaproteobacteria bacterium]